MKRKRYLRAVVTLLLALVLACLAGCESREPVGVDSGETAPEGFEPIGEAAEEPPTEVTEPADLSLEAITEGLALFTTKEFIITRPEEDMETVAENYYITGVSDPERTLRMNGITIESRGELGSFGVYVPLELGENRFRFEHGEDEHILFITRLEYEDYALTSTITGPGPSYDLAVRAGSPVTLSCTAPSGAVVTATVGEVTVDMAQSAATEVEGVPTRYTAGFDPGETEGTAALGPVAYVMSWNGITESASSPGSLFAVGAGDELLVGVQEAAVTTFHEESDESGFQTMLKKGAVDRVDEISYGSAMYKLASGGWVFQHSVTPEPSGGGYENEIGDISFEAEGRFETITFHGTATPPYRAEVSDGSLLLTLYHANLKVMPELRDSELITGAFVSESEFDPTIDFRLDMDKYWGYLIRYDGDDTVLTLKRRPEPGPPERPLENVTVLLDPGHGGTDNGAAGVALTDGAMEKEINLATAIATRRYLEGLGATVSMTRDGDEKTELDGILTRNEDEKPDFFLSLHSNSLSYAQDGTEPSGVEVFYYEDGDAALAERLSAAVSEGTRRVNRDAKQDYYRVTLCSLSRSLLIEMGFLTNPVEYDSMRSMDEIYNTAIAIGDGLVAYVSGDPGPVETDVEAIGE